MMKKTATPQLPHCLEIERAILGSILIDSEVVSKVMESIRGGDFYSPNHQRIFKAMLEMERAGEKIDVLTLTNKLSAAGELQKVGGVTYLASLSEGVPFATDNNLQEYMRIIQEKSTLRHMVSLGESITSQAIQGNSPDEIAEAIDTSLSVIHNQKTDIDPMVPIRQVVAQAQPVLERVLTNDGVMIGTATGFSDLDRLTAGWSAGDLVVLAARPSGGKSALCLEFLRRQARQGRSVALFSLEMSATSILLRLACREAGISSHRLRSGYLSGEERSRLNRALSEVTEWPVWISDRPSMTAHEVRWRIRSLAQREKISLVLVDYLQLLRSQGENRTQQVTAISLELKAAAGELGKITGGTLIAVSQLNRVGAQERPQLHHLRESGQLEQDADTVLFIRDGEKAELGQSTPWSKCLEVAKQRNGPTGVVDLLFLPEVIGFEPKAKGWEEKLDEELKPETQEARVP